MDFEFHYTAEVEEFRREVRAFIEENALKEPVLPMQQIIPSPELFRKGREMQRKLGARGWFAPAYPGEYGGGGLDVERCVVLAEEMAGITDEGRWILQAEVSPIMTGGIMAQGTEEQKRRFLPAMLSAEIEGWQCFTEPDAGTDEASMKSTAVRDGDFFIINGTKVFVGSGPTPDPDYLYWPAVTDPAAPRHHNLSAFFIPGDLPGIHYQPLDLISSDAGGQKWEVICEDVRCPADRLIGELNKGWLVTQATLAMEHGGAGAIVPRDRFVPELVDYCRKTMRNGQPISKDPIIQDLLVRLYTEYQVMRLWGLRNFAMSEGQIPRVGYTGTQTALHHKLFVPQLGKALLDIIGPHSLIDDGELQVLAGRAEYAIRQADVTHPGGTPEVQKIMMSRALGLGRAVRTARK